MITQNKDIAKKKVLPEENVKEIFDSILKNATESKRLIDDFSVKYSHLLGPKENIQQLSQNLLSYLENVIPAQVPLGDLGPKEFLEREIPQMAGTIKNATNKIDQKLDWATSKHSPNIELVDYYRCKESLRKISDPLLYLTLSLEDQIGSLFKKVAEFCDASEVNAYLEKINKLDNAIKLLTDKAIEISDIISELQSDPELLNISFLLKNY